jgi:hypothetical protein
MGQMQIDTSPSIPMTHSLPLVRPDGPSTSRIPPAASQAAGVPDRGGEGEISNPATGRLSVQTVERLHRLLGGDVRVEDMALRFIADHYRAATLLHLPAHGAREILKRPADFVQAAKNYCEPELKV